MSSIEKSMPCVYRPKMQVDHVPRCGLALQAVRLAAFYHTVYRLISDYHPWHVESYFVADTLTSGLGTF